MNSEHCRKLFKDGLTFTCSAFRFPHGNKSSVQGFQFYVLKFFPLSKRIFEGFELVCIFLIFLEQDPRFLHGEFPVYDTNHSSVLPKNTQIYKQTTLWKICLATFWRVCRFWSDSVGRWVSVKALRFWSVKMPVLLCVLKLLNRIFEGPKLV